MHLISNSSPMFSTVLIYSIVSSFLALSVSSSLSFSMGDYDIDLFLAEPEKFSFFVEQPVIPLLEAIANDVSFNRTICFDPNYANSFNSLPNYNPNNIQSIPTFDSIAIDPIPSTKIFESRLRQPPTHFLTQNLPISEATEAIVDQGQSLNTVSDPLQHSIDQFLLDPLDQNANNGSTNGSNMINELVCSVEEDPNSINTIEQERPTQHLNLNQLLQPTLSFNPNPIMNLNEPVASNYPPNHSPFTNGNENQLLPFCSSIQNLPHAQLLHVDNNINQSSTSSLDMQNMSMDSMNFGTYNSSKMTSMDDLRRHDAEAVEAFLAGKVRPGPNTPQIYKCKFCGLEFMTSQAIGGHMTSHYQRKPKGCLPTKEPKSKKVKRNNA